MGIVLIKYVPLSVRVPRAILMTVALFTQVLKSINSVVSGNALRCYV